jgi:hypothetical protein
MLFLQNLNAQNIAGVYNLVGVMETAAGFKLNEDSTFEFYFSYGALDRYGSGTYKMDGDRVIFNSASWPGKDFKLLQSSTGKQNHVVFELKEKNTMLLPYVYFTIFNKGKQTTIKTDSHGMAEAMVQPIDSIGVQFEFTPERMSVFKPSNPNHNYFSFAFEQWVAEVFFKNYPLKISRVGLNGKLFLLGDKEYDFERSN